MNPEKLTKVRIEVTDRLIKKGRPNHDGECPFALALKKVVAKNVDIYANYGEITLRLEIGVGMTDYHEIPTPATVSKFMEKFDAQELYDETEELPPLPKAFSINLKIKNKFLRPGLRA